MFVRFHRVVHESVCLGSPAGEGAAMSGSDQFAVTYRRNGAEVIAAVHGEIDCVSAPLLAGGLADLIDHQGNLVVLVDLVAVSFIDSSGLAVLVRAREGLARKGGRMVLAEPSASARKVLDITGLSEHMEIRSVKSDA